MLSWEYPPKVIGGLARAVADLSRALVIEGHEVVVVTGDWPDCAGLEVVQGVEVHRVNQFLPEPLGFLDEVHLMNFHLVQKATELLNERSFDVIHGHDWLVAPCAKVLKHAFKTPLIATIHATEWGRNNGLHNDLQRHISSLEWWLTYEACGVICCSEWMRRELRQIFQVPEDKLEVIPNGVRVEDFNVTHDDLPDWRRSWALPEEKIVLYVGRHVYEKGIDLLIESTHKILQENPLTKFIVAGMGPLRDELQSMAWEAGLGEKMVFPGFVDDLTRNSLYRVADTAVFPSRYEPFGIVALEAMAGQTPVIVSDIGGFAETVQHEHNGLTFYAGNANSLADSILRILKDQNLANSLQKQASQDVVQKYGWNQIAKQTLDSYEKLGGVKSKQRKDTESFRNFEVTSYRLEKEDLYASGNHGRRRGHPS